MNVMKIGSDSLKITLSTKEVEKYRINEELSYEETKRNFINLMIEAKTNVSFKIAGEKLVAEIFSGKNGECEIFLSRVEVQEEMYKDRSISQQEMLKKQRQLPSVFSCDSFEKLLMVAKRLNEINYTGSSSIYYDEENERYFLMLEDVSVKDLKFVFISEYAKSLKPVLYTYVREHYKCICKKDAVKLFAKLN